MADTVENSDNANSLNFNPISFVEERITSLENSFDKNSLYHKSDEEELIFLKTLHKIETHKETLASLGFRIKVHKSQFLLES